MTTARPLRSLVPAVLGALLAAAPATVAQEGEAGASEGEASPESASAAAAQHAEAPVRKPAEWNLGDGRLALSGHDPVAYFPEFGGKAVEGSPKLALEHDGAVYRFASEAHREAFRADPSRFEPAYGGWCAWAMAQDEGEKVEVEPESFVVQDGRLLLFYDGLFADTRKSWRKGDASALARSADANWTRLSGEPPRTGRAVGPADGDAASRALAPDFALEDPNGTVHRLADLRGRVVVLDFWATWCPPCREAMPGLQELHERYADRPVTIFGVNVAERSPAADPAGYMREKGYTYTMLRGTDAVAKAYRVHALPTFAVIGPDGTLRETHVGGGKDVAGVLGPMIEAALPAESGAR